MKIISKYKDFYDSFGYIIGTPDESVVYIRKEENITNNISKNVISTLHNYVVTSSTGACKTAVVASVDSIIVGIYPYIYVCPFYVISKYIRGSGFLYYKDIKPIPVPLKCISDENSRASLYDKVQTIYNEYCINENIYDKNIHVSHLTNSTFYSKACIDKPWQIENREIFREIGSPVFMYLDKRSALSSYMNKCGIYTDIVFDKQPFDIINTHRQNIMQNRNVYTDIEDFLIESKQMPITEPSNNTKIINAGFDPKTSFRNIK